MSNRLSITHFFFSFSFFFDMSITGPSSTNSSPPTLMSAKRPDNLSVFQLRGQQMDKRSLLASLTTNFVSGPLLHKKFHVFTSERLTRPVFILVLGKSQKNLPKT